VTTVRCPTIWPRRARPCARRRTTTTWCSLRVAFPSARKTTSRRRSKRRVGWKCGRSPSSPGKPLAFGQITSPGRDVASSACRETRCRVSSPFLMLVRPFCSRCRACARSEPRRVTWLRADFDWLRPDARREFLRARGNIDGGVDLFSNQGAGVLTRRCGATAWSTSAAAGDPAWRCGAFPAVLRVAELKGRAC
jgi:hypothetical protein